jgi:hypothetical protein
MDPRAILDTVKKRKSLTPCQESNHDSPACSLITVPTALPWLPYCICNVQKLLKSYVLLNLCSTHNKHKRLIINKYAVPLFSVMNSVSSSFKDVGNWPASDFKRISPPHYGPGVDPACNRNEYQESKI